MDKEKLIKTKVCTKCGVEKALSEFYNKTVNKEGKVNICKECYEKRRLKEKTLCRIKIKYPVYFKNCTKCNILKPIIEFSKNQCACKVCRKSQATDYSKTCHIEITHKIYFIACSKCRKLKPLSEYYNTNRIGSKTKKESMCIYCKKSDATKYNNVCHIENKYPVYFRACTKCKKLKHVSNFSNNGNYSSCKLCISKEAAGGRERLESRYVRGALLTRGFRPEDITEGLIVGKRASMKLRRAINGVC